MRTVYFNGNFIPEKEARVSVYDSALMFGDMVFEMTRSFKKNQFKLRDHLERLYRSMHYLKIEIPQSIDDLEEICLETIERNEPFFAPHDEHRLMINVSRGPLSFYAEIFDGKLEPTVVVTDFPLKWTLAGMGPLYETGVNAVIPAQQAIPAHLLEPKVKNRSRVHYMRANIEVAQFEGNNNWALLLDPDGFITEGTGSNFFIVKGNVIISPEGRNILRGISRDYVMYELATQLGLPIAEMNFGLYDVKQADEAFFTATPFCIMPVTKINGDRIGDGKLGTITNKLMNQWSENVEIDIVQQMKDYSEEVKQAKGVSTYKL